MRSLAAVPCAPPVRGSRPGCAPQHAPAPQAARGRRQGLAEAGRCVPGLGGTARCGVRLSRPLLSGPRSASLSHEAATHDDLSWPQRDCGCGTLRAADAGRRVTLCGWVDKQRNLGGLVFVDVRDHTGIVQVVSAPEGAARLALERVRPEYVILVTGTVRSKAAANERIASGAVEVLAEEVRVLNVVARSLPFQVGGADAISEEVRLRCACLRRATGRRALTPPRVQVPSA